MQAIVCDGIQARETTFWIKTQIKCGVDDLIPRQRLNKSHYSLNIRLHNCFYGNTVMPDIAPWLNMTEGESVKNEQLNAEEKLLDLQFFA